jgi:hypothetical protein
LYSSLSLPPLFTLFLTLPFFFLNQVRRALYFSLFYVQALEYGRESLQKNLPMALERRWPY